ncbi:LysE family translocator [Pseudodesulfovibrio sp.]|uniref:LysE family translocator n=1 Tax=unclassified Pseudodesulfovibrio TaxID=2661612 RepID=UPI003AFF85D6
MHDGYLAFVLFVIVMTGTPGAGNLSMMALGQRFGFRAALPFLAGTTVGALSLNLLVGLGLGGLLLASPQAAWLLRMVGMAYILYLAWKIITMRVGPAGNGDRLTFVQGLFLHPTNPKSWAMSVVGFSQLADTGWPFSIRLVVFVLTFLIFQVSAHSLWGLAGASLMRAFSSPRTSLAVTGCLAAAMVGATAYALFL